MALPMTLRLDVAGLALPTHATFVAVGAVVGLVVYRRVAKRHGMWDRDHLLVALSAIVVGALFAKAGTGWRWWAGADEPTVTGLLAFGGKSVLGGLAGAWLGVEAAKWLLGMRHSTGDLFAPAVAAAMAVGRVGCLLTEYPGTPTSLPWAVTLPADVAATLPACVGCTTAALHPSFAYEIGFHVLSLVALVAWGHRIRKQGEVFKYWLLAYGVTRFGLEFVRGNPTFWLGLSGSQLFLLVTMPLLAWRLVVARRWGLHRPPPGEPVTRPRTVAVPAASLPILEEHP